MLVILYECSEGNSETGADLDVHSAYERFRRKAFILDDENRISYPVYCKHLEGMLDENPELSL